MSLTDELVEPAIGKFTRYQWILAGLVMALFFGFVDTLFIATILGYLGIPVGSWFGVPTTFSGFFVTGAITGRLAPPTIVWEPPSGVLIFVLLMMLGMVGLRGHGFFSFLFYFVVVPAIAVSVCYAGVWVARKERGKPAAPAATNNPAG
jgi:hypothetical protein